MAHLIQTLVDVTQIQSGALTLRCVPVDLGALAVDLAEAPGA